MNGSLNAHATSSDEGDAAGMPARNCPLDVVRRPARLSEGLDTTEDLGPRVFSTAPPWPKAIAIGQDLGPYRIEALLGAGGMGVVYRARERSVERPVAIKVVGGRRYDATAGRGLVQEARVAGGLAHPSICAIHGIGHLGDQPYIIMELVEGSSLRALITPGKGLPLHTALNYAVQIVEAVAHAHRHGVVHRDLKSSNIMITPAGDVKVLDFGLAVRLAGATDRADGETTSRGPLSGAGSLPYMSPERLRNVPVNAQCDIWALGVLFYEMVSGTLPFQGNTRYELASAILCEPVPRLSPSIPAPVRSLISRCLWKDPARRYQGATELAASLARYLWP